MTFSKWLNTYCDESNKVDLEETFEITIGSKWHLIPCGVVIEHAHIASDYEQKFIKETISKIDFANGDPMHFFRHLATCIARESAEAI